jgi:hypothetical protein
VVYLAAVDPPSILFFKVKLVTGLNTSRLKLT